MTEIIPVTVVVPVKNEEASLATCLDRLKRFAEVVVVDSGSTDATHQIAENYGARVVDFKWDGRYPKKRNWVLLNYKFTTDWVLFLDADELVDDSFCKHISELLPGSPHSGFWLTYRNYFLGRELRHGVPQRKLALMKVGSGLFEQIEENAWSTLDMEVHEHPVLNGTVGVLSKTSIEHRDDRGIAHFLRRHLEYANWEAARIWKLETDSAVQASFTGRQKLKYRYIQQWWYAPAYFVYTYFVLRGFLDGSAGFYYAVYKFWYFVTIRVRLMELHRE